MLTIGVVLIQRINNGMQVIFIAQEVGFGYIHKQGLYIMLFDIVRIGFLYTEKIFVRYILFVGAVTFFDIHLQPVYRRMQVDEDIRLNELLVYDIKQSLVKPELVIGQVHFCKEQAFGKQVVGNGHTLEKVLLLYEVF